MMDDHTHLHTFSAYGGAGWQPRSSSLREEIGVIWQPCGLNTEWARLRSVLLHRPGAELAASSDPNAVNMLAALDIPRAQSQHDAIAQAYRAAGVKVYDLEPAMLPPPNQLFLADLFFMTPEGAILARPVSSVRAGEERIVAQRLLNLGIPILRSVSGYGTFEGADALWLDPRTVILGYGLRTNAGGASQVSNVLSEMNVEVVQVDMPIGTMHLMGMLRIADNNLAIAWPTRLAQRAVEVLRQRGYQVALLPDEQEAKNGFALNFVTLGPREILMAAGNPVTQAFYERLGIKCLTVEVDELAKAAGTIGCLTGVVQRDIV